MFPALTERSDRTALRFGDRSLTHAEVASAAGALAAELTAASAGRVAVWATNTMETAVGEVAALLAGVPAVPLNPKSGARELTHVVADSKPSLVLAGPGDTLPPALESLSRLDVDVTATGPAVLPDEPGEEEVSLAWLAEQLRVFVDLNPDFEVPVERLATWLARLDDEDDDD
jgi:malonyl-CoA/methylmalonyl-CoA synthetase